MPIITIDDVVSFAPNIGVLVHKAALDLPPEKLASTIKLAYSHMDDELLCDACHGGYGPLANYSELGFSEYLILLQQAKIAQAGQVAKRKHTKVRRAEFNGERPQLVLAMIEARIPYTCSHPSCNEIENLTVDHIIPLSRGGTDELSNLRFLCRSHNSAKGDRPA